MAKRSKFFCIAVEGATCDGRTLDLNALTEMAETYDPATYTARINMEHIRGFSAEPPFNAYGDVVALETREVEIKLGGKTEKKLGLFAQVDALDTLVELKGKGQKLFSSIELNPNFAGTGKAYLQGLAVTDSPASLGTEIMAFAAKAGDANPFSDRKIDKANFFSASQAIEDLEFVDATAADTESSKLMTAATDFFANFAKTFRGEAPEGEKPKEEPKDDKNGGAANDNIAAFAATIGQGIEKLSAAVAAGASETKAAIDKLRGDHDALAASIDKTENRTPNRPVGTGAKFSDPSTYC